jgi:hypothetical protein
MWIGNSPSLVILSGRENDKKLNEKKSDLADCGIIAFCQKMLECLPGRRGTTE